MANPTEVASGTESSARRSGLKQSVLRRMIKAELERRRTRNPRYSLRAFARDLEFNSAHLSEVLNGKRAMSLEAALRLVERFSDDPKTVSQLQDRLREKPKKIMVADVVLRNPVALAVLAMLHSDDTSGGAEWIARNLGLKKSEVESSLRQLRAERLVTVQNGRLVPTVDSPVVSMGGDQGPMDNLEFSSLTVCVDPRRLPEAKQKIDEFMLQMREFFDAGSASKVYELQVQLYPWAIAEGGKKSK